MYRIIDDRIILRTTDNACIPADPDNADYQAFLAWCAKGNKPEPKETQKIPSKKADQVAWEKVAENAPEWARLLAKKMGLE